MTDAELPTTYPGQVCETCRTPMSGGAAAGGHKTHPGCDPDWDLPHRHTEYQAAWRGVTITDQPTPPFAADITEGPTS